MGMGRFIHLHAHSHYSFLQALPKVPGLVKAAVENGMDAVGLTDTGNLHGAIELYKAAEKKGIKPIIGVDMYLAPRTRFDKDPVQDAKRSRIVLLAENNTGYQNLLKLVSAANIEGYFEKPRVDRDLLREYKEGDHRHPSLFRERRRAPPCRRRSRWRIGSPCRVPEHLRRGRGPGDESPIHRDHAPSEGRGA